MSDYNLQVKVRNARILRAMRKLGMETAADLSRASGVSQSILGHLLNLKLAPRREKNGEWRQAALAVADALCCEPDDLWTVEQQWMALDRNVVEREVASADVRAMLATDALDPSRLLEGLQAAQQCRGMLDTLSPRERQVISAYYGIGCDEQTFGEIGDAHDVSSERVRQIEIRALQKLRSRARRLGMEGAGE